MVILASPVRYSLPALPFTIHHSPFTWSAWQLIRPQAVIPSHASGGSDEQQRRGQEAAGHPARSRQRRCEAKGQEQAGGGDAGRRAAVSRAPIPQAASEEARPRAQARSAAAL